MTEAKPGDCENNQASNSCPKSRWLTAHSPNSISPFLKSNHPWVPNCTVLRTCTSKTRKFSSLLQIKQAKSRFSPFLTASHEHTAGYTLAHSWVRCALRTPLSSFMA